MGTGNRRSALSYIPGYKNNAVLQLIIFSGSAYLALAISWSIIMIVYSGSWTNFNTYFLPNISLGSVATFQHHWWTIFTYGWFQQPNSFLELASGMLWLYCFGSVVQMLIGPKHVIPLYAYSLIAGGIFYMAAQLLPGQLANIPISFLSGRAGIIGMAVAAFTLTPNYKFYLTETFTIPLLVIFLLFCGLAVTTCYEPGIGFSAPILLLNIGGSIMGFVYVKLTKAGYQPAGWAYSLAAAIEGSVTPKARPTLVRQKSIAGNTYSVYQPKQGISQRLIDEILDKINQKGYDSLSNEEREILQRAGRE